MNTLIITGSTGFLGSNFLKKLKIKRNDLELIVLGKESKNPPNTTLSQLETLLEKKENHKISVFHFATFYSKDTQQNKNIYEANIVFGSSLLEKLNSVEINNFIYTNTMFAYDENERNHYYTETKIEFSNILKKYYADSKNVYSEIYLDNTFGESDQRNKIIHQIIKCILQNQSNPVSNKKSYINLSYVDDIVNCLLKEIEIEKSTTSRITSKYDILIFSIFEFLLHYYKTGVINLEKIKIKDSKYLTNKEIPALNEHFTETDIFVNLTKLIAR